MNKITEICESTQLEASQAWSNGTATHYDWFCSLEQTKGRGRRGNTWVSNRGNFFFSVILPDPPQERITWGAMMGALAVARALVDYEIQLKWPNDLYFDDGKCGGVIAERVKGGIILGVGVNLVDSPAIKDRRTSKLYPPLSASILCQDLLRELQSLWQAYLSENEHEFSELILEFKTRSYFKPGSAIRWVSGTLEMEGSILELGNFGELIVRSTTGERLPLYSEEVFGLTQV